jgi:hypothetical protein
MDWFHVTFNYVYDFGMILASFYWHPSFITLGHCHLASFVYTLGLSWWIPLCRGSLDTCLLNDSLIFKVSMSKIKLFIIFIKNLLPSKMILKTLQHFYK